jgi:G6PDH family F420-dependent oxidoreductase
LYLSAFGAKSIELAATRGDGLVTTKSSAEDVQTYRTRGGRGPVEAGVKFCYGEDEDEAVKLAHRLWGTQGLPGELSQVLPSVRHFEQAATVVTEQSTRESVACGPDPKVYAEVIEEYAKAGVDVLHVAQIGPEQDAFFDFFDREVRPLIGSVVESAA